MRKYLAFLSVLVFLTSNVWAAPKRFTSGVTNVASDKTMGQYIAIDPTAQDEFYDNFYIYVAANWTLTTTEGGTGSATEAVADEDGGVLLVTNAAGDNDHDFFQTLDEVVTLETGKKNWFRSRFKVSDATQSDFVCGLQVRDTTPLAVSDGVWFQKDDGDTNLDFHVAKASSQSSQTSVGTVADDTYLTTGFYFDGGTTIHYFLNNAELGTVSTSGFPTTELTVSFGVQNGEGNSAKTMSMDYILAAKER
jgi:hypothetical protein